MQSKAKIILQVVTDAQQAKKQAKNIGESVAKSAEKGAKKLTFGAKVKENLDKIKVGVENIGIGGDKLSKLGQLFKGGGWIAVATAAIGLLAKGAMALWDKMTLSAEEAIAKAKKLREISQKRLDTAFKNETDSKGYIDRLKQLNQQQELSNLQKMEAITIVNQLSKTYKDLGLSVSTVTGKVLGLDQAMDKVAKQNQKKKAEEAQNVYNKSKLIADQQFKDLFTHWYQFGGITEADWMENFSEFQTNAQGVSKGIDTKFNQKYKTKYKSRIQGTTYNKNLTQQQKKMAKLWNSGLQGKAKWAEQMAKQAKETGDEDKYLELHASILKMIEAKKQLDSINKTGFKTEKQYLQYIEKENKQVETLRENIRKQAQQRLKARKTKEQAQFYNSLTPTSTKIAYKQIQKSNKNKQAEQLKKKKEELEARVKSAEKELSKNTDIFYKENKTEEQQKITVDVLQKNRKKVLELSKQLYSVEDQLYKKYDSVADIQTQINNLQKKQSQEKFNQIKADEEKIKKLKQQLQLEKKKESIGLKNLKQHDSKSKSKAEIELDQQEEKLKKLRSKTEQFIKQYSKEKIAQIDKKIEEESKNKSQYSDAIINKLQQLKKKYESLNYDNILSVDGIGDDKALQITMKAIRDQKQGFKFIQQSRKQIKTDDKNKRDKIETQIVNAKMRQLQIEAQIEELNKRSVKYYQQQNENLDKELAVEKLMLQGKYQEAEKQRLINQLKEQGLKIDQKQIDSIMKKKKQLNSLNVDKQLKNQGQSLLDKFGLRDKNSRYQKRVRQLQQANKTSLTDDQKQKVKTLVDLQIKTEQLEKLKPNFSDLQIKTNQLTARGGFAGGAVVPNIDAVNKQIRDYEAKSYSTLTQIKQLLSKGGVI